jgi:hypothetical protein
MLHEISEEVRVALKDRLRDVRHAIRLHRHDGRRPQAAGLSERLPLPRPQGVDEILGHAVSAFDDAMTLAERLVPVGRSSSRARPRYGFAAYFAGRDGVRAFRRDLYSLARLVLARRGLADARIYETELAAVHASLCQRHAALIASLSTRQGWVDRVSAASALCAAILTELLDHRPIRFDVAAQSAGSIRELELLCLTPVVLACGFAAVEPEVENEPDLIGLAILATEARLERIVAASRGGDSQEELTRIFAVLLAHLP